MKSTKFRYFARCDKHDIDNYGYNNNESCLENCEYTCTIPSFTKQKAFFKATHFKNITYGSKTAFFLYLFPLFSLSFIAERNVYI